MYLLALINELILKREHEMKKIILISAIILLVLLIGCANKSYYHPATESFASGKFWTGLILIVELIIGLGLVAKTGASAFGQNLGSVIGSAIVAFLMGYIILGEWGIRIFEWFIGSTIGTILVVIANFFGGIFALFNGTVSTWVLNTYHWHSPEVLKYALIPALIGGAIQLILLAKAND